MNLNQAIPGRVNPTFSEGTALASVRDSRNNSQLWKKVQDLSAQLSAVTKQLSVTNRAIGFARRKPIPGFTAPPQLPGFYPFKIYQPSNIGAWVGKTCPLITSNTNGIFTTCTITAASVPTNLDATPPTVSIADTWRFIAVRSGLFEYRPIYPLAGGGAGWSIKIPGDPNNYGFIDPTEKTFVVGGQNYEATIPYTDGVCIWEIYNGNGYDAQTDVTVNPPLVIGIEQDESAAMSATIWLQITPDTATTAMTATLMGCAQVFTEFGTNYNYTPGPYVIPIGEYAAFPGQAGFEPTVYQFVFGNITNRYPGGNGNFAGNSQGTMLNIRGSWVIASGITTTSPADLASQLFYPGDSIGYADQDTEVSGLYQFTAGGAAKITGSPASDGNWTNVLPAI